MKLRKLLFVLPNLFTVSSIFCGFYALTLCTGEAGPAQLYQAALAIFFGIFFDGFDGRVARLTKTQSMFGQELDSLADVVTFGAAPALVVYKWALQPLGILGTFIAFMFAACGALRLARFNVLAIREDAAKKAAEQAGAEMPKNHSAGRFFVGLPIPLAAGVVISMIIAHHGARGAQAVPDFARGPIAGVVVFLALLMVSTIRYRTFKDLKLSARAVLTFMFIIAGGVVLATLFHPAWLLVGIFSLYLLSGMLESVVLLRAHLKERRAAAAAIAATVDDDDEDEDEDDVDEQEVL
ncbi:MAG: CDP-diacylglycerol--serine O-phosphatidyltransferase [Myxococcaceae bacterium]|nr:CDP-diacylglycerol--serine O-phosphatidyltransferase [Myxococcaceae bacterium]